MTLTLDDLADTPITTLQEGASPGLWAVVGVPQGEGPWPVVVLVHEIFGIDEQMRKQVVHLTNLGYLVVMPDLFSAGGMRKCVVSTMKSLSSGKGRAYADLASARQWALDRPDASGAVGILGFCMGGGFALMTASAYDAASVNYGTLPQDLSVLEHSCPIVASYGGKDVTLKGAAEKLETALTGFGVTHDIKEYPDAGHVFMNEELNGFPWLRPIVRVMNFGPNPEAAVDAWARIEAFFSEHLAAPPTQ